MRAGGVQVRLSADELRQEISARNLVRAERLEHEATYGSVPSVVYAPDEGGKGHGNFLAASYRRISADAGWRSRLEKSYTAGRRLARQHDRWRAELDCANSSDALLMNLFCYPGILHRPGLCRLLDVEPGLRPTFGVRVGVPLLGGGVDRTEVDMQLGVCLVEAKLTESGFQSARASLVERYRDLEAVFEVEELPRVNGGFADYQLIRGVLAAHAREQHYVVVCDGRRAEMMERWLRVMGAVRWSELRGRLRLLTWQELAAESPGVVRRFLAEKYGIVRDGDASRVLRREAPGEGA